MIKELDLSKYLETEKDIQVFLNDVVIHGTASDFILALGTATRARSLPAVQSYRP
jgi:DNA-binding phage protein